MAKLFGLVGALVAMGVEVKDWCSGCWNPCSMAWRCQWIDFVGNDQGIEHNEGQGVGSLAHRAGAAVARGSAGHPRSSWQWWHAHATGPASQPCGFT